MREEDALRTVDCLRGRLQAERAASRAASENVDLLANKLTELEKQLKTETKYRRKVEKKLKLLKKKLESLNISCSSIIIDECCEQSSSSNNLDETSCISSISSSNYCTHKQEDHHQIPESEASKCISIRGEKESEVIINNGAQNSDENCHGSHLGIEEKLEKKRHGNGNMGNEDDPYVDDSISLAPVSSIVEFSNSLAKPMEVNVGNVAGVLDTLKQIREQLQSSMYRSKVG